MANPRALDKRRKSIKNIRKITRTMELIATARFKKAMDRASAATSYTRRITQLVSDLTQTGLEVSHPLLEKRETVKRATLLVLTANRGLCGGFNGNLVRAGLARWRELTARSPSAAWKSPASAASGRSSFAAIPPTWLSRTSRTSPRSTKSTSSPAAISRNTNPASSTGSTSCT